MSTVIAETGLAQEKPMEATLKTKSVSTVIVCSPGIIEQSLKATLTALPAVDVVGSAPGCLSALGMVREMAPILLVVDANVPGQEVRTLLRQVREDRPRTRSLALTRDRNQRQRLLSAGADAVFRRDGPVSQLAALIRDLNYQYE